MQQASVQSELQMAIERSDEKLRVILIAQLEGVHMLFTKFEEELREFGPSAHLPVALEPVASTDDPDGSTPGPVLTQESTTSTTEPVAPAPEPLALRPEVVTPIVKLVAPTPDAKSRTGGIFIKAINNLKRWGDKLPKHRDFH